ncbi:MAG: cache domain-containing protein, partial [Arcobacteraceae bacterium]
MKNIRTETSILNLIKYGAISSVCILAILITVFFIAQKNTQLEEDIKNIEKEYIVQNKQMTENLVNKIYSLIDLEKKFERIAYNKELEEEINQAHQIASQIYLNNINRSDYSKEKTLKLIKESISKFRFNIANGYIFIYEMTGKVILNTQFPNLENKNLWNYKDEKGTLIVQEMNKILQEKDETYYDWYWKKKEDNSVAEKKRGYFKKFEPYNLFIGTGYYESDFIKETQKRVLSKINSFKLTKPEHIFVYDKEGTCLVNPKKELIGVNRINTKNESGVYVLKDMIDYTLKNKEGFVRYNGTVVLNKTLKFHDKVSFVKLYDDWNWMIGSGFYLEELSKKIQRKQDKLILSNQKNIQNIAILAIFITAIMLIISFYLSKIIEETFSNYKIQVSDEMNKSLEKEKLLIYQSKMATMGEMIGSITHQWKQPLSLLSMSSGMLRLSREDKNVFTDTQIDESLNSIDYAIDNINHTINDFKNFFNPNKERTLFLISDAIDETFKLISSQFKNNNIEIIKNISDVSVYGSQNELQQTFINLLKNAKEELVKKSSSDKKFIFIDIYSDKSNAIIKIKDNANGITENIINKVFDSYFTTKDKDGGSGIGLYMCKQIIEGSMKGIISVENIEFIYEKENYKGAEFTISIPMDLRDCD